MTAQRKCRGTNAAGDPCKSPIVGESGYCPAHDPELPENEMQRRALRGALAAKRAKGIDPDTLGPLDSPSDAQRWLERTGRAVASGRLTQGQADAVTRAVRCWLEAFEKASGAERVRELEARIEELEGRGLRAV